MSMKENEFRRKYIGDFKRLPCKLSTWWGGFPEEWLCRRKKTPQNKLLPPLGFE
jgi:hypothetical protein